MASHARRNERAARPWPKARFAVVAPPVLPAADRAQAGQRLQGNPQPSVSRPDALPAAAVRLSPDPQHAFDSGRPIARSRDGADTKPSDDVARILLDDICRERERNPDAAFGAVLRLATLLRSADASAAASVRGRFAPWQRRKVERYFKDNLTQPLRGHELAKEVSLSVAYFYRMFKRTFGETPHAYLIRLRLDLAQELMLSTREPLSQIALASGFADQPQLSKHFRRWLGQTPSVWRRQRLTDPSALRRTSEEAAD